jgi:pimeloyl-ACP methyl ester carboxylesterase
LAQDADGKSVDQRFDLVLTYDYENLSTPIAETAVKLKQQLADAGLREGDDKRLTLLVHSMGGLVSRWFIEREGGNRVVDHLVMFGTPNAGSPFGTIDLARQLASVLTTLAINTFPAFAPFGGALVYLLNRSQESHADAGADESGFRIHPDAQCQRRSRRAVHDPGGRHPRLSRVGRSARRPLIAKVGRGVLFDTLYQDAGHDIAVSLDSIRGVADSRTPSPEKRTVICHHLNYFVRRRIAMAEVAW